MKKTPTTLLSNLRGLPFGRLLNSLIAIAALFSGQVVQGANVTHALTGAATNNWSTATFTNPSGTWSSTGVIGDLFQYNTATGTLALDTLTLDTNVTLGVIKQTNTGALVIATNGTNFFTLDATGLLAANQDFGNAGVAQIGQAGTAGALTINPNIVLANTNVDIGTTTNSSSVTIGGNITASTNQTIFFRANSNSSNTVTGNIGASGSNIAIQNVGTSTGTTTISGNLGASVTTVTENSASSGLTIGGAADNTYTGTTTLTQGTLTATSSLFTATQRPLSTGQLNLNGGTINLFTGGATGSGTGNTTTETVTFGNNTVVGGTTTINVGRTSTSTASTNKTIALGTLSIGANNLNITGANNYGLQFAGATTLTGNATFNVTTAALTLTGAIGDGSGGFGFTKLGAGALTITGAGTYGGATVFGTSGSTTSAATTTLSGASGSISGSSGISIFGSGTVLSLDNTLGNVDRIKDTGAVNLGNSGELSLTGNATTNTTETMGAIGIGAGQTTVTIGSAASRVTTLAASSLVRTSNGTAMLRGSSLNQSAATNVSRITLSGGAPTGADFVGSTTINSGATNDATQALKIVPWLIGDTAVGGTGSNFVTYDTTLGLRVLLATEDTNLVAGSVTQANPVNANVNPGVTITSAAGLTVNSLLMGPGLSPTLNGSGGSLTVNSGAVASFVGSSAAVIGSGFSSLILGNGEGILTVTNSGTLTINTPVNVTGSSNLTKAGSAAVVLTAANLYTGATTINAGTLTIGNGTNGSLAGSGSTGAVTVNLGTTFALNQASGANLAANVANLGTFNITNNGTQTLSGNISGAGGGTFSTIASSKTLILSGANTFSNGTSLTGTLQAVATASNTTGSTSTALSANSAISMNNGATLQLRADADTTFSNGIITMNSDISGSSDTTSFNFDVNAATSASNKTLTLGGTVTFTTNTSGNRGNDVQTINLTGATGYTLAITNALGASSNGQVGQNYQYNVASGLTLSVLGGLNSGIGGSHIFQGAGNTIVGTLTRAANRPLNVFANQTGTVTFNSAANDGAGSSSFGTAFNAGTTVFNNAAAVNGVQINLGNQTASSTADANFLLGGGVGGLTGGLSFGSTVRPFDTTSGKLTIGGMNTSGTNTYSAGIQLGNTASTGKSVNLAAAAGGQVDFTNAIANNGTDTTAGISINDTYIQNAATVTPTGTVRLAGANTYRGTTTIAGGTLLADSAQALNTTANGGNVTFTGGTLKLGSTFNAGANADISGRIKNSTSAISIDTNGLTGTYASALDSSNAGGLTKLNTGTLILTAANGYTGTTTVTAGTLKTTGSGTLGSVNNNLSVTSTLDLNGTSQGVGALSGAGTIDNVTTGTTNTLTVGNNDATGGSFSGVIKNTTGTLSVTKTGSGTQTLTGINTYTGATTVSAGTLQVGTNSSTTATTGTGNVAVTGGSLTGTGTISASGKNTTISGSASLMPGDATAAAGTARNAILNIGGNLVTSAGGTTGGEIQLKISSATVTDSSFANYFTANGGTKTALDYYNSLTSGGQTTLMNSWNAAPSGAAGTRGYDYLNIAGSVTLATATGGKAMIGITTNNYTTQNIGDVFNLLDWNTLGTKDASGSITTGGFTVSNDLALPTLNTGLSFDTSLFVSNGIIVVVPEPSRVLLLLAGMGFALMRRRRTY